MTNYIGIDLGTTNSAICSYNGTKVRIWKSPEQNDVTPSAIFINKRGNKYYGTDAYENAPSNEESTATLFKRYLGTNHTFTIKSTGQTLTPEECSAEMLKVLYGYLPEEIRNAKDTATVITVPAAFNQMKKDATLVAASLAGIGKVALMQEPVAAIMSVVQHSKHNGYFIVYDLGGGTFDVSIAQNINGKVNLLAQGGKEMCGGRDWDRLIFNEIIMPWLIDQYNLPEDFAVYPQYRLLHRLALYAAEKAKIQLSSLLNEDDNVSIVMDESKINTSDEDGKEIYIDIPMSRESLNKLIGTLIDDTIEITRDTMSSAGLSATDIDKIVFVGGPTKYKPLRDIVSSELVIPANIDVNPMTAVAEGAAIFAESIDWCSNRHDRKSSRIGVSADTNISFRYESRTSDSKARVAFLVSEGTSLSVELVSSDTGWTSGRADLRRGTVLTVPLSINGVNTFVVTMYDNFGAPLLLKENRILITKTMATISTIPASHSISIKVLEKKDGPFVLLPLVQKNDELPKKGSIALRAGEPLKANSNKTLSFSMWEGDIEYPIEDNLYIGEYVISGKSFENGIIPTGAEIICEYEVAESGAIHLGVSVPCIGVDFGRENFYSSKEGLLDLNNSEKIIEEGEALLERISSMDEKIDDERLFKATQRIEHTIDEIGRHSDAENINSAIAEMLEIKKIIAKVRNDHLKEIRQMDLDSCAGFFTTHVQKYATQIEIDEFNNLSKTAQRSIDRNDNGFDNQLDQMRSLNFAILWKQDWFVIDRFNLEMKKPYSYTDQIRFEKDKKKGQFLIADDKIDELRDLYFEMYDYRKFNSVNDENMFNDVNVIKG